MVKRNEKLTIGEIIEQIPEGARGLVVEAIERKSTRHLRAHPFHDVVAAWVVTITEYYATAHNTSIIFGSGRRGQFVRRMARENAAFLARLDPGAATVQEMEMPAEWPPNEIDGWEGAR